jgi:hypothetical protein
VLIIELIKGYSEYKIYTYIAPSKIVTANIVKMLIFNRILSKSQRRESLPVPVPEITETGATAVKVNGLCQNHCAYHTLMYKHGL